MIVAGKKAARKKLVTKRTTTKIYAECQSSIMEIHVDEHCDHVLGVNIKTSLREHTTILAILLSLLVISNYFGINNVTRADIFKLQIHFCYMATSSRLSRDKSLLSLAWDARYSDLNSGAMGNSRYPF